MAEIIHSELIKPGTNTGNKATQKTQLVLVPSDNHQDPWVSQWHQWHSSNPMMCTRPMPIKSYLGPCETCHSLRRTCNTYILHCQESNCTPHLHDWHANVQARMLTPLSCPCSCPCPAPSSLHHISWCLTAMCALQQKHKCTQCIHCLTTMCALQQSKQHNAYNQELGLPGTAVCFCRWE